MPINCELRESGHVVYIVASDPWTAAELRAAYRIETPFFDAVGHRVHTLANLAETHHVPAGVLGARSGSPHVFHPNRGEIAIVGASSLLRALLETAVRVVRFQGLHFFDTEDEAWDYLRAVIARERSQHAVGDVLLAQ